MYKSIKITFLIITTGLVLLGTSPDELAPVSGLNYEIVNGLDGNPGGGIKLTWSAPPDYGGGGGFSCRRPENSGTAGVEYVVSVDGVDQVAVDVTEAYVYTAGAEVAVYAVYNDVKSTPVTLDFGAVESPSVEVWSVDDPSPDHPSGFGFCENGTVATYAESNEDNSDYIDYYVVSGLILTYFYSHYPTPSPSDVAASSEEPGTYDDLDIVAATGVGTYSTSRALSNNGLYGLWIDANANGYDESDNFGKALVTGIDGHKVTFTFAYQTVAGLRWVVVD
jgi:hypothetical protein